MSDITYINKNLLMEGSLESKDGQVVIAGNFKGNIVARSVIIEPTALFNGNINAEHLKVEGEKMSKSSGNFFTLRELIEDKKLSPSAVRYTLISTHYRQRLNFTFEKIDASQKAINRLRELYRRLNESNSTRNSTGRY